MYDRSGQFQDLKINEGLRCFLRFNLDELLPKKFPVLEKVKPLLSLKNWAMNVPNELRLKSWKPHFLNRNFEIKTVPEIDEKLAEFISNRQENQLEKRSAQDLNWLLKNPWLLPISEDNGTSKKYHFSAYADQFELLPLTISDLQGNQLGFVILAIRGNDLKVPYCYADPANTSLVADVILKEMLQRKLRTLTVFQPELVAFFKQNPKPFIHLHPLQRHYIISRKFAELLKQQPEVIIQDGDADCAFT